MNSDALYLQHATRYTLALGMFASYDRLRMSVHAENYDLFNRLVCCAG